MSARRVIPLMLIFALATLGLALAHLAFGSVRIPVADVWRILCGGSSDNSAWDTIVRDFRMPRVWTAASAGAALAMSGLQMQTLFRNPLAGPYVLGISSGASLGVAIVVLGGLATGLGLTLAANIGAISLLALVLVVSRRIRDNVSLLILGLMFGYAAGAVVSVLMHLAPAGQIQRFVVWGFGSFAGVDGEQLRVLLSVLAVAAVLGAAHGKAMNALLLGEDYAVSLGLNLKRVRVGIIVSASLLAGTVTAYCGPVAFLGVAVPHLCRGLLGTAEQRVLMPAVVILGAGLALLADIIVQLPGQDMMLPLNAVTAFVGAPVVVWVVVGRRRLRSV